MMINFLCRIGLTTVNVVALFLFADLISQQHVYAKKAKQKLLKRPDLEHAVVIGQDRALVNRELQSFVGNIGIRVFDHVDGRSETRVMLLDSGRVDSFYSSSGYVYLTRGLLVLARNESHVASIIALEAARMDSEELSELELYKRAAEILEAAEFRAMALPEFLSVLLKHRLFTQSNEQSQVLVGQGHAWLDIDKLDSNIKKLISYVATLESTSDTTSQTMLDVNFSQKLNGLVVGQAPRFNLRSEASQVAKEEGFTIFMPKDWSVFRGEAVAEVVPIKLNALDIQSNESTIILRSTLEKGIEIIVFSLERPENPITAEQALKDYLDRISTKSKVSREGTINGDNWQGYFVEGRMKIKFKKTTKTPRLALGTVSITFKHLTAITPLKDKLVLATTFINPFSDPFNYDYDQLDRDIFMDVASNIAAPIGDNHLSAKNRIKIHKVAAGETIASLAQGEDSEVAEDVLRILNGMSANESISEGQTVKLIDRALIR